MLLCIVTPSLPLPTRKIPFTSPDVSQNGMLSFWGKVRCLVPFWGEEEIEEIKTQLSSWAPAAPCCLSVWKMSLRRTFAAWPSRSYVLKQTLLLSYSQAKVKFFTETSVVLEHVAGTICQDRLNSTSPNFFPQKLFLFIKIQPNPDSKLQKASPYCSTEVKAQREGVSDSL